MIPVIDIFAGPGGLGEGFCSWRGSRTSQRFELAVSIEKDVNAHSTLRLRAFRRGFGKRTPMAYDRHLRGEISWDALAEAYPAQAKRASAEARLIELGRMPVEDVRELIAKAVPDDGPWVLVGGPPCQAYSLVGRSRNKGNANYRPELDHRQKLYVEYLQVLADHAPSIFVMENVKGLLSARLNRENLFSAIREDLADPASALKREGRPEALQHPKYEMRSLMAPEDSSVDDPSAFVVKAEEWGVPQRRHRVILLGVRSNVVRSQAPRELDAIDAESVGAAIGSLPRLRSGLSKTADSGPSWGEALKGFRSRRWTTQVDRDVRRRVHQTLDELRMPAAGRGHEYAVDRHGEVVLNHSTRGHMPADLERYLFASAFAAVHGVSPVLGDFPKSLLPKHENVSDALGNGLFADRFRVQVREEPATTITSHISKDGHYYIHYDPSQCRSLTVREAARLQTFPDDYFFCGPRTAQYQQVGNAVPPKLGRMIAGVVAELLGS